MSWIDTRDIGAAAAVVLADPGTHAGAKYTLTGPEALSYADAAQILSETSGRSVAYRPLPCAPSAARCSTRECLMTSTASNS